MRHVVRLLASIAVIGLGAACTPHFNRDGKQAKNTSLTVPLVDFAAQGGGVTGNSSHFKVSRVAIAGGIHRGRGGTSSGKAVQGGPVAPH